jgi:hypothetical protein
VEHGRPVADQEVMSRSRSLRQASAKILEFVDGQRLTRRRMMRLRLSAPLSRDSIEPVLTGC